MFWDTKKNLREQIKQCHEDFYKRGDDLIAAHGIIDDAAVLSLRAMRNIASKGKTGKRTAEYRRLRAILNALGGAPDPDDRSSPRTWVRVFE
jgi:hypothetical protein